MGSGLLDEAGRGRGRLGSGGRRIARTHPPAGAGLAGLWPAWLAPPFGWGPAVGSLPSGVWPLGLGRRGWAIWGLGWLVAGAHSPGGPSSTGVWPVGPCPPFVWTLAAGPFPSGVWPSGLGGGGGPIWGRGRRDTLVNISAGTDTGLWPAWPYRRLILGPAVRSFPLGLWPSGLGHGLGAADGRCGGPMWGQGRRDTLIHISAGAVNTGLWPARTFLSLIAGPAVGSFPLGVWPSGLGHGVGGVAGSDGGMSGGLGGGGEVGGIPSTPPSPVHPEFGYLLRCSPFAVFQ